MSETTSQPKPEDQEKGSGVCAPGEGKEEAKTETGGAAEPAQKGD